ncbi:MAG TPA: bifunctional diaminohydroxyphosphoribosylaminopyrimidine deaminase/5-amino-6-(5-phosphoribosylamino)uracil reductase RibD [Gemmataceae bacterium]|nr:bifunctional diaminohydroxyphosphoribosylaminopyrimidine deaminase/5-amino-6-(5-phosphoribosylamino)uracil reductase RibD [Gemmataceae bacterium]
MTESDEVWMRRALELAERGRGYVEPNPLVGAAVVHDGHLVGEGWHQRYGEAHAEIHALAAAGEAAQGATLYVTLEPCCHHGKTPPCTDAVLRAGIRRVVAAMPDPFPAVAGKGAEQLRQTGVTVDFGVGESEARRLNAPYLKLLATGRPWVHAKWAMTLDGKIATRSGDSRWISNEASRRRVHELRGRMDAILAGIGTVLADNPQLTARPSGPRTPARVVLDSQGRIHEDAIVVQTARVTPTLIAATERMPQAKRTALQSHGCEVLILPEHHGRVSVEALLTELGRRRFTNVLVEGGSGVFGAFLDAAALDELHVFIGPRLIGGAMATSAVGGSGVSHMTEALRLAEWTHELLDGDLYIHGSR